jgi:hypothetical protein
VVRISGGYDAGNAEHGGILAQGESGCNGIREVSFISP